MKKSTLSVALIVSLLACIQSFAQTDALMGGQKAGLWEIKLIKQTMDGKDMLAQFKASQEQMQQAMAKMSPDQRAKMQAMVGEYSSSGTMKVCVSPAMVAKNQADKESQCPSTTVTHSGSTSTYAIKCTKDGRTTVGTGIITSNGDVVSTDMNVKVIDARGQRNIQTQSQMTYLGTDCHGVTPTDQLMNNMKTTPH